MSRTSDNQDNRLPIKLDSTSNGEFLPIALSPTEVKANEFAMDSAEQAAKHTGSSRRQFLRSSCGAAATLLAFNHANAWQNTNGGSFELPADAAFDPEVAAASLEGREFIFDVQGHYLPPNLARTLKPQCEADHDLLGRDYMNCLGADNFIKDVFMDSDTDMMALSFIPSSKANEPLSIEEAHATREMVESRVRPPSPVCEPITYSPRSTMGVTHNRLDVLQTAGATCSGPRPVRSMTSSAGRSAPSARQIGQVGHQRCCLQNGAYGRSEAEGNVSPGGIGFDTCGCETSFWRSC